MKAAHRRVRQSLLAGLLGFLAVQAVVVAIQFRNPWLFRDRFHGPRVRRYTQERAVRPQALTVVQLGSSRTGCGLCGKVAEPWLAERLGQPVMLFNMGFPGAGLVSNRINLQCLLNDGVRPDLLLLEVLPPSLNANWSCDFIPGRYVVANLRPDELPLVERMAGPTRSGLYWEWLSELPAPLHTHRLSLVSSFAPTLLSLDDRKDGYDIDRCGWQPFTNVTPERAARQLKLAQANYFEGLQNFSVSRRIVDIVSETLELARSQGIAVALVVMPEGPTFRGWYPPGVWQQIHTTLTDLAKRHDVPLIDMRDSRPESDFMDSHHLLTDGARTFTLDLARRIEPLLRGVIALRERKAATKRAGVTVQRSAYSIEQPPFSVQRFGMSGK